MNSQYLEINPIKKLEIDINEIAKKMCNYDC